MDASSQSRRDVWRVGDLVIDEGQQRVTRGDEVIELPKLSFDLLLALVRSAPNVVSIDELLTSVWPGVVVNPETVVQRVKMLRDALDDRAAEPRYIAALRGRGYRLVAEVSKIEAAETRSIRQSATGRQAAACNRRRARCRPAAVGVYRMILSPLPWRCSERSDCGSCSAARRRNRRRRTPMTRPCARSPCCRSRT